MIVDLAIFAFVLAVMASPGGTARFIRRTFTMFRKGWSDDR